jgi:hypothetical protein
MAVLLEFDDANGDACGVEEIVPPPLSVLEIWTELHGSVVWLTPALARRVAQALTKWADKKEGR